MRQPLQATLRSLWWAGPVTLVVEEILTFVSYVDCTRPRRRIHERCCYCGYGRRGIEGREGGGKKGRKEERKKERKKVRKNKGELHLQREAGRKKE